MLKVRKEKILIFDTETTGLPDEVEDSRFLEHEILQLAMIDGTGAIQLNEMLKPSRKMIWPDAQKIHGISPQDVQNKPGIETFKIEIQRHVDNSELLVAYNFQFDYMFLRAAGISFSGKRCYDVMREFARKRSRKGKLLNHYVSLKQCAAYYGYELNDAHDAEADARATLFCFLRMQENYS